MVAVVWGTLGSVDDGPDLRQRHARHLPVPSVRQSGRQRDGSAGERAARRRRASSLVAVVRGAMIAALVLVLLIVVWRRRNKSRR
jgi:hypothetical protein